MNIALAQLNFHIGNFDQNVNKMIEAIGCARDQGAELVVFSELAICGYPPRDFLEFSDFIAQCQDALQCLARQCTDIAAIVGCPCENPQAAGKDLFNAAFFLHEGEVKQSVYKSLLPTYDVFDEYRYFEPGREWELIKFGGKRIALTICEDIWSLENELYSLHPMDELARKGADLMINIAASPFSYNQRESRLGVLRQNTTRYGLPIVYVNHVGAQTELLFDGASMVMNGRGELVHELKHFEEDLAVINSEQLTTAVNTPAMQKIERIHNALVMGVRDYFQKLGFKKAILGLSGGIDSAVTLVLVAKALGAKNVRAVMMPSRYSSEHSITDSKELASNLGCEIDRISIEDIFKKFEHELAPSFKGREVDLAEENIQARVRGVLLMALSNKFGYILLNTSNKSEAAVGYGTLYGDMCGGLSVLGDVYKTEVFELANYINSKEEIIPQHIIDKPPSAELRHDQKDSDSLPDYADLDRVLLEYIENRKGPREIIAMGYDEPMVRRILKMVNINEYKRHQMPPVLRVSSKAFGMGRRMPIVGKYLS